LKKLFFCVFSRSALSHSRFLAIEITSGNSRSGESVENRVVNGTGIDSIDSTFVTDLSACYEFVEELRLDAGALIYDASRSGAEEEQETLLSNTFPFPLIRKLSIVDPAGDLRDVDDRHAIQDDLHFLVWRKRGLEATGKGTLDTIDFLDLTGCTWASAKGVIEVLMSELGSWGLGMLRLSGQRRWRRVRVVMVVVRMIVMMRRRLLVCRVEGFGVGDSAGVVVDGGGLTYEESVCILILSLGVALGVWWDYVGAELE
jgi:hypothetical protein